MQYRGYLISRQAQSKNHDFSALKTIIDMVVDEGLTLHGVSKKLGQNINYAYNKFDYWRVKKTGGPLATMRKSAGIEPSRKTIAMSKILRVMADTAESMERNGITPTQHEEEE